MSDAMRHFFEEDSDSFIYFNKETIEEAEECGCYYCLNTIEAGRVEYEDGAPICPVCSAESIVPFTSDNVSLEKLQLEILHDKIMSRFSGYASGMGGELGGME